MEAASSHSLEGHSNSTDLATVLTDEDVQHFRQHGWVKVENFWTDDELQALRTALTGLVEDGRLANVATEGDGETHTSVARNLQLCPLAPEAPLFRSLPFHPRVAAAVHRLLCRSDPTQSACCYLSQVFWKPAHHGLGTAWHQDNAYFQVEDASQGAAMWTAIHDATVANGAMRVLDSRPAILPHAREPTSDHHITCKAHVADADAVPLEVKAGGVIFFDFNVPHCTTANLTDRPRAGLAYHFLNQEHWRSRAFPLPDDADWRTPVVAGPLCTGGEDEYGVRVDTWSSDMADVGAAPN